MVALEGLITDVIGLEPHDFKSLVETRVLLEKQAAKDAAMRRSADDIVQLSTALKAYENKILTGESAVEEDLLFHIKIAEAGKNGVLKSLMMIITPDIVTNYNNLKICDPDGSADNKALREHELILQHIINQDGEAAEKAMLNHLHDVLEFSKNINE